MMEFVSDQHRPIPPLREARGIAVRLGQISSRIRKNSERAPTKLSVDNVRILANSATRMLNLTAMGPGGVMYSCFQNLLWRLLELLPDPGKGLELREDFEAELEESIKTTKIGVNTKPAKKVAEELGLEW